MWQIEIGFSTELNALEIHLSVECTNGSFILLLSRIPLYEDSPVCLTIHLHFEC